MVRAMDSEACPPVRKNGVLISRFQTGGGVVSRVFSQISENAKRK